MLQALIGPLANLAGTFLEKKVTEQKAKATLAQTEAEAKAETQAEKLASKSMRRYRKHRKSLKRPLYRNHPNIQD